jgi:hypothetical protein
MQTILDSTVHIRNIFDWLIDRLINYSFNVLCKSKTFRQFKRGCQNPKYVAFCASWRKKGKSKTSCVRVPTAQLMQNLLSARKRFCARDICAKCQQSRQSRVKRWSKAGHESWQSEDFKVWVGVSVRLACLCANPNLLHLIAQVRGQWCPALASDRIQNCLPPQKRSLADEIDLRVNQNILERASFQWDPVPVGGGFEFCRGSE